MSPNVCGASNEKPNDNGDDIGMNNQEWNDFGRQQRSPITNYLLIHNDNDRFEIEWKKKPRRDANTEHTASHRSGNNMREPKQRPKTAQTNFNVA